jgi:5-formyltetrahydrofolate cyclo-ligase
MEVNLTKENKAQLRKEMLGKRALISLETKKVWDHEICKELIRLIELRGARVVHTYIPFLSEIDIRPMIEYCLSRDIKVVAPKTLKGRQLENRILSSLSDLETGIMGTLHPAKPEVYTGTYDFIIVPGLAIDNSKFRLGYGGGYYDNFLINCAGAFKVGIYYPFQLVDKVPTESHDVALDAVFIPEKL